MAKRVLDVGNCSMDHGAIRGLLQSRFGAEVDQAHELADALAALRARRYDLVLVNRKLDADYSDGLDIIKQLKAEPELASVPAMLITNYPEHQQTAVAAGAELGFGKRELQSPQTFERLARFLGE